VVDKLKLGEEILANLASIQGKPHASLAHADDFELPRLIGADDGRSLQVTKAIDDLISSLARQLKSERPESVKAVREAEYVSLVRAACGPVLAELDLDRPFAETGKELVSRVEKVVDEQIAAFPRREHAFGVTLFGNPGIATFSIGPVTFEEWGVWLARKKADGEIPALTESRLRKAWGGGALPKRKSSIAALQEQNILRAMSRAPYVASVQIEGFAASAGLEAAASSVRLAITTAALLWPTPSRALEGIRLRFDPAHHTEKAVTFVPGRIVMGGVHMRGRPFGPTISSADWKAGRAALAPVFAVAGEAIDLLTNPQEEPPRVGVMRALLHSLQWFYAGCRELNDPIAIVNFGASLDALASGAGDQGILALLKARFGLAPSDEAYHGGPTVEATVKDLYGEGRSQLVHGISKRIGHDWAERRARIENLAHQTLLACLEAVSQDQSIVKAKQLRKNTK